MNCFASLDKIYLSFPTTVNLGEPSSNSPEIFFLPWSRSSSDLLFKYYSNANLSYTPILGQNTRHDNAVDYCCDKKWSSLKEYLASNV